jgi:preprotein translocase subunit SecF
MIQFFKDVKIDWLANRRKFIAISILLMVAGLSSAVFRQWKHPNGTEAFNLGVDFKGGTVVTVRFKQRPAAETIRDALIKAGLHDAVIQPVTDKPDIALIKIPLEGSAESQAEVELGRSKVRQGLQTFGKEAAADLALKDDPNAEFKIEATDAVGAVAGAQLRNKAIAVTLAALVGILMYIAFRFEWTYGAAAVIAVFHDVLVTLGFFSIFQWEVSLTVIAALLTLVGFSVNDTIVVFDRIRENRRLHRRESLYKITNDSINQTLSRTVITSGLVFLSVLSMVLFGGEVLRGFSLALLIGISFGTYSSVAIASPIMVWWEQRLDMANRASATAANRSEPRSSRVTGGPKREPLASSAGKRSRGAGRA